MAKSDLFLAFNEITETHHLPRDIVIDALKQALVSAYRRDVGMGTAQRIEAEVDPVTSKYRILVEKEVVESVEYSRTEITLDEARAIEPTVQLGDMVMAPEEANTRNFGRIAAQTAKQVILQKIREAERKSLYDEYKDREGDLVSGLVQSVSNQHITISLGRAEALMPGNQQIRGERYYPHDRIRAYVMEVKESSRGPQIIVSRGHKNMLRRLLEYEVPEIYNGQVEIKSIAREAGYRSKVAVSALQQGVDPVGACVGIKGTRIQNIVRELKDEKIDVIEWNADPQVFIAKALSPARVTGVYLEEELDAGNTATVIVPDDQLSLAIGREGQNARLAAKLTGWRIDIKSVSEAAMDAYTSIQEPPLSALAAAQPDLTEEVNRIIEKKRAEKPVQPEEYATLARFVQLAELELLKSREQVRLKRRKAHDLVRPTIPAFAFSMPLSELELAEDIENAIKFLPNVGELMIRLLVDETSLQAALRAGNAGADAMDAIKEAIDSLVLARQVELEAKATEAATQVPVPEAVPDAVAAEAEAEDEEAPPAFVDEAPAGSRLQRFAQLEQKSKQLQRQQQERAKPPKADETRIERPAAHTYEPDADTDTDTGAAGGKKKDKKQKQRGRELVFDERRGEVVAKRKRKGNRRDWANYDEE